MYRWDLWFLIEILIFTMTVSVNYVDLEIFALWTPATHDGSASLMRRTLTPHLRAGAGLALTFAASASTFFQGFDRAIIPFDSILLWESRRFNFIYFDWKFRGIFEDVSTILWYVIHKHEMVWDGDLLVFQEFKCVVDENVDLY